MRIGIVETGLPPHQVGGAEMQAWNLARQLQKKGHEVTVFCRRSGNTTSYERNEGIDIFRIKSLRKPFGILSYIAGVFHCIKIKRQSLDVLLCFRAWPNGIAGLLVQQFLDLPTCFSIRGGDWYFVEHKWWGKIIYRLLFSSRMPVLVQTEKIGSEVMSKYPSVQAMIIPNGIDCEWSPLLTGKSILFVGNLIPRKGVDVLIEAVSAMSGYTLKIAGDGPEYEMLQNRARGMPLEFVGRLEPEKVRQYMADHGRVLVLPAVAGEGMPNVLLEAMSIGVPVVASDIAGIRDLLDNGRAGILVKPGDAAALREALINVLSDSEYWNELSMAGRKKAEKYSWDRIVEQWEQLFQKMVSSSESGMKTVKAS